jgi:hypothetical protein
MWQVIAGGLITIIVAGVFEYWRAPKIVLSIGLPLSFGPRNSIPPRTNLRINVSNQAFPFLALRSSALRCRATITFHDINNGQAIFAEPMQARWAGSPENTTGSDFFIGAPPLLTCERRASLLPFPDRQTPFYHRLLEVAIDLVGRALWPGSYCLDGPAFYTDRHSRRVSTILGYPTQFLAISNIFIFG